MHKLGKLEPTRPDGVKDFIEYASKLPKPAKAIDYGTGIKSRSWGMDGNDTYGDCTIAGIAHLIHAFNLETAEHDSVPGTAATDKEYFTLSGSPGGQPDPQFDNGLVEADVLKHWRTSGLFGHKIAAYVPVKPTDTNALRQAIQFYGGAYLGVQLPESAEDQFNDGQPWTVVVGSQIAGGHCIVAVGYDANYLHCVTWGAEIKVAWDWWAHYGDEAWCVIASQDVEAGHGATGLDLKALEADLASV